MKTLLLIFTLMITACTGIPEGLHPVAGFDAKRYIGKWYEIARLPNRFEAGLDQITADYQFSNDGGLHVTNSGKDHQTGKREYAYGKAYFIESPDIGSLKVSFFGPFYAGYHIVELDKTDYSFAMISGSDRDYLWILARSPKLDDSKLKTLIEKAKSLGFDTEKLIFPEQSAAD